jgi:hypothetical protein
LGGGGGKRGKGEKKFSPPPPPSLPPPHAQDTCVLHSGLTLRTSSAPTWHWPPAPAALATRRVSCCCTPVSIEIPFISSSSRKPLAPLACLMVSVLEQRRSGERRACAHHARRLDMIPIPHPHVHDDVIVRLLSSVTTPPPSERLGAGLGLDRSIAQRHTYTHTHTHTKQQKHRR